MSDRTSSDQPIYGLMAEFDEPGGVDRRQRAGLRARVSADGRLHALSRRGTGRGDRVTRGTGCR